MEIVAPTDLRQWPSESEYMPLLRSLAARAARVAINMALLTELFAAPAAPVRHVTDAYRRGRDVPAAGLPHRRRADRAGEPLETGWEACCLVTSWNPVLRMAADGITFGR